MLAPILAAIIIILLIIYAAYPLLINKDFHGWANIALTALILFTVIVILFVILGHQKGNKISFKTIPNIQETSSEEKTQQEQKPTAWKESGEEETPAQALEGQGNEQNKINPEEITDEEALMMIAREYVEAEEAFKAQGASDYQQKAAQQIIDRYDFTNEDWQSFLEDAAKDDLFNKAKAEMK